MGKSHKCKIIGPVGERNQSFVGSILWLELTHEGYVYSGGQKIVFTASQIQIETNQKLLTGESYEQTSN